MRRYLAAYALWLLGVLSAAGLAYYYYRSYVLPLGEEYVARLVPSPPEPPAGPSPQPEADPED